LRGILGCPVAGHKYMSKPPVLPSSPVDSFLQEVERLPADRTSGGPGRLLFAMDGTASREPTWDHACTIQGEMA